MSILTREGFHALTAQAKRDLQRSTDSVNVMVCAGTCCIAGGAMKVYEYLKCACERRGIPVAVSLRQEAGDKGIHLKKSGCHGFCVEYVQRLDIHQRADLAEAVAAALFQVDALSPGLLPQ